jgi:thiol-disulfide isomerase/thioredoxin
VKDKKFRIIFSVAILVSIFTMQCYRPVMESGSVAVGQAAPQFTLPDLDGHRVSLEQYEGKIVILDFWATWCGPCRITMPVLDTMQEQYSGKLVLIAVDFNEPKELVREYVLSENPGSKVLLDEDGAVGDKYGVISLPTQILIDQEGTIQYVGRQGIAPGWDSILRAEINKLL